MIFSEPIILKSAALTIHSNSNGVKIIIDDKSAGTTLCEIFIKPAYFTAAIGGLAYVPIEKAIVYDLDKVNKQRETRQVSVKMMKEHFNWLESKGKEFRDSEMATFVENTFNEREDGEHWRCDRHFESQGSIVGRGTTDDFVTITATIRRWI